MFSFFSEELKGMDVLLFSPIEAVKPRLFCKEKTNLFLATNLQRPL
ncbi:hypothetical protein LEP1GSC017_0461 [Leptospira meyeri serovar Hardjo str. Went 5]|nr:hypothetical protein LEP1GSC017_0461 [Leptospira meyeri serovar Hardjo str. Went 5]